MKSLLQLGQETNKEKAEANHFAISLLMPGFLVREYWTKYKNIKITTKDMADLFGVPLEVMEYRMRQLKLI